MTRQRQDIRERIADGDTKFDIDETLYYRTYWADDLADEILADGTTRKRVREIWRLLRDPDSIPPSVSRDDLARVRGIFGAAWRDHIYMHVYKHMHAAEIWAHQHWVSGDYAAGRELDALMKRIERRAQTLGLEGWPRPHYDWEKAR